MHQVLLSSIRAWIEFVTWLLRPIDRFFYWSFLAFHGRMSLLRVLLLWIYRILFFLLGGYVATSLACYLENIAEHA